MTPTKSTPPPPATVEDRCPQCRKVTTHSVIKGRTGKGGRAVEGTFSCEICQHVHQGVVRLAQPIPVPFIISEDATSEPAEIPVFADMVVHVGDAFEIDEKLVEVTSVETKDQRRVKMARADEIMTIWGKNINVIHVPFALNVGEITRSQLFDFGPDEEITVGEVFDLDGKDLIIDKVITDAGKRFRGTFSVREIRRVWLRKPGRRPLGSKPTSARDSTPQKQPRKGGFGQGYRGPGAQRPTGAAGTKRPNDRRPPGAPSQQRESYSSGPRPGGRPSDGRPQRPTGPSGPGRSYGDRGPGGKPGVGYAPGGRSTGGRPESGSPGRGRLTGGRPPNRDGPRRSGYGGGGSGGASGGRGGPRAGGPGRGGPGGRSGPGRGASRGGPGGRPSGGRFNSGHGGGGGGGGAGRGPSRGSSGGGRGGPGRGRSGPSRGRGPKR